MSNKCCYRAKIIKALCKKAQDDNSSGPVDPTITAIKPAIDPNAEAPENWVDCPSCGETVRMNELINDGNEIYCKECTNKCNNCNKRVTKHDHHKIDDEIYCNECAVDCPNCGHSAMKDYLREFKISYRRNEKPQIGCSDCLNQCSSCEKYYPNNEPEYGCDINGYHYCSDCIDNDFSLCERCGNYVDHDSSTYVENVGSYCDSCFEKKFANCETCNKALEKSEMTLVDGDYYCDSCNSNTELGENDRRFAPYKKNMDLKEFSFNPNNKTLDPLKKLAPISVKDLKRKYPALAAKLTNFIRINNGKDITKDMIEQYEAKHGSSEKFNISYGLWNSSLQRSYTGDGAEKSQLVLKILCSNEMIQKFKENGLYEFFDSINNVSKKSTHPFIKDQFGWARLELDNIDKYILIDEIQSDHMGAINQLKTDNLSDELDRLKNKIKLDNNWSDEEFKHKLATYDAIVKNFPDVAIKAISEFARANGYNKLYWHTYEGGKKLKQNDPPKSLYDTVPKQHSFIETDERPFNLSADFFSREASLVINMIKCSNLLNTKYKF